MPRTSHRVLNKLLPVQAKMLLKRGAISVIPSMRHLDEPSRLFALMRAGLRPAVVYDIGSAHGAWARLARSVWPAAQIVGFEPNLRERESLERTAAEIGNYEFHFCFLGSERGEIEYTDQGTQTSALRPHDAGSFMPAGVASRRGDRATSPVLVIDELIEEGKAPAPSFLKLDVQGYELEVLKGAERAMAGADGLLLEISLIDFLDAGMPLLGDVIRFMGERGFVVYDIVSEIRRVSDDALLQLDAIFLPSNSPLRSEPIR
ncbi:MAG: FkbM family methyltransferase [Planctomycetota bacterium]